MNLICQSRHLWLLGWSIALFAISAATPLAAQSPSLELKKGDHIAIIGNTFADRMQHAGWLETYIHATNPELDLTFRNLGYPGDELKLRSREENFGSPDQWLEKVEASVIFCFFGYNEALRGEAGLAKFKTDLASTIDGMLQQKYDGKSAPRLVFFSPIAHENLKSPHLPDGSANNVKLALYTQAMKEVCSSKQIPFVDLFTPSLKLYQNAATPLTMNGIHLLDHGDLAIAQVIMGTLFPKTKLPAVDAKLETLRQTVLDKNYHWFSRYRVVDGYNVFGGRSQLAWFGQSNADVMMREMEIFDVKTSNRDLKVWATARGSDYIVKDDNLPKELEVKTNIPGKLEGGKHEYLGGTQAIEKMKIAEGMQVNLFASEEMFPEVVNPVQMAVDTNGRLFVSVWPSYPHWNPTEPRRDKIICLPDDNGDGVADRCVTFADELNSVTGFEFWGGGMLVAALPEIWFLKDTDGDDKADVKIRMLQGVCSADSHHSANAMLIGPDGWLYWSRGIFNIAAMETPTQTVRSGESGVHRFNPRTFEMEFHFPIGPNPHGDVFDQWGYQFANDGTGGVGSYVNIGKGISNKPWFKMRVRPVAATGILSSSHFPEKNQGNFLVCNCIGFLGVLQHEVKYNGADITATEIEPILVSSDPNFRPTDVEIGGDGALYVSDWSNAIIGHMQHNMRDPNRDHEHGRIYRVTAKDRPTLKPVPMKGKPITDVCQAFFAKENSTRYRARLELSGRDSNEVITAIGKWSKNLDPKNPEHAQALLEALWVHEEHRVPDLALLSRVFQASEARVRAAAIRTLGHWGGKITNWESILAAGSTDESALVRAEAVKSAVNLGGPSAPEVIYEVAVRQTDPELETVLKYGRQQLKADEALAQTIQAGKQLSPSATQYALRYATVENLGKLPKTEAVFQAILDRPEASTELLRSALQGIAKLRNDSSLPVLLALINQRDRDAQTAALATLRDLLLEQPAADLRKIRNELKSLAENAKQPATRQLGFAAWITATGSADNAFASAFQSKEKLRDLLQSIALINNQDLKNGVYASTRSLMFELPPTLEAEPKSEGASQSGIAVDYFYPTPSNVAKETLASLKPQASGVVPEIVMNVPQRKEPDAFALRFTGNIMIPTAGKYQFFVASDDGSRIYIDDKLLVNNDRLQGMTEQSGTIELTPGAHQIMVTYFDNGGGDGLAVSWKGPGFAKQKIAPDRLSIGASAGDTIHDLAVKAVASIPGHEPEKFVDLTRLIKSDRQRPTAITVLKTLPATSWDAKEIPSLVDNLVGYVSSFPAKDRTTGIAVDTVELIKSLATKLPKEQGSKVLDRLQNLDVRTIAVGTVVERMNYDKEKIVLQAGKPVEFRFSNTDNMPHNFVIVQPGALEDVGLKAEASALEADAKERNFVPVSDRILLASKLLDPGQSQAISFDVPKEPGMYPYVCTYPGHWRRMFGVLVVVENIDEYQLDPEKYLAAHPLAIKDELLNSIGRNTEWKLADFTDDLKKLDQGRSYEVGKNLFKAASCVGCHKLGDEGRNFGPELSKLDPKKLSPDYVLKSIIEPSAEIDQKYQSSSFLLDSGTVVTGLIVEEDDNVVKVLVDPLAKGEPVLVAKSEIDERKQATTSIMPQGLLSKLTKEEVLDLVAFLVAKGDKSHKFYGKHDHNH